MRRGVLQTKGFHPSELADHFMKHVLLGREFKVSSALEYERLADGFLGGIRRPSTHECKRRGGDLVRYDRVTEEFGASMRPV